MVAHSMFDVYSKQAALVRIPLTYSHTFIILIASVKQYCKGAQEIQLV